MTNKKVVQLAAEVASYMTGSPFENHERILALVEAVREDTLAAVEMKSLELKHTGNRK